MGEKEREIERGREREEKCVVDCEAKQTVMDTCLHAYCHVHTQILTHTHAQTHSHTDNPGLILPARDRQICCELIKCLPLTYAGASG